MIVWTVILSLQLGVASAARSEYQEAYDQADRDDKPLLVLVGAEWCPGCRTMKEEMIPQLQSEGGLSDVVFTMVDADRKPDLSRRLLRGNSIPQLVLYTRSERGWRRAQLTGVQAPALIRRFLRTEMTAADATESAEDALPARVEREAAAPQEPPSAAQ